MVYTIRVNGRKRVVQRLFNDDSINEVLDVFLSSICCNVHLNVRYKMI